MVSVIVPVYNSEKSLYRCVNSIILQSYKDLEIILVDDGSMDRSLQLCKELSLKDERIKVLHQENGGVSSARNLGISFAAGYYVTFVDSDDVIEETLIEKLVCGIEYTQSQLCISALNQDALGVSFTAMLCQEQENEIGFLLDNYLLFGPVEKLYLRSIITEHEIRFPEGYSFGEDLLFNFQYLEHIQIVNYVAYCGYWYMDDNENSLSRRVRWNMYENDMVLHQTLIDWFQKKELWTDRFKCYMARRIFDTSFNSIMLFFRKDCTSGFNRTYDSITTIVRNPLLNELQPYLDASDYASWVVNGINKGCAMLLTIASFIKRR